MPTKNKHMARKASIGETAPLAKQIKKENESESARVILDSDKVELATKELAKIPKKGKTKDVQGVLGATDTTLEQVWMQKIDLFVTSQCYQ